MNKTIATLKKGQSAKISENQTHEIPLELLEIGCLPGSNVEVVEVAPLSDPLHIYLSGGYFSIRKETAAFIAII